MRAICTAPRMIAALGAALLLSGCVTLNKYDVLRERVFALEREQALAQERLATSEGRVENLYDRFQEDKTALRQSGAAHGATLDDLRMELAATGGKIEELAFHTESQRHQLRAVIDALDERFGTTLAVRQDEQLPPDEEGLFTHGATKLRQGALRESRGVFRVFLDRFAASERAPEARLLIAETYMTEEKYDLAIREFQSIHDVHPKSEQVPKALWRIGDALVAQRQCKRAAAVLDYLRKTQRRSAEAEAVPERLKEIAKSCE